jgi:hypothetical protein
LADGPLLILGDCTAILASSRRGTHYLRRNQQHLPCSNTEFNEFCKTRRNPGKLPKSVLSNYKIGRRATSKWKTRSYPKVMVGTFRHRRAGTSTEATRLHSPSKRSRHCNFSVLEPALFQYQWPPLASDQWQMASTATLASSRRVAKSFEKKSLQ